MKKLIAIVLLTTFTSVAFAHSGGTDSSGCHTNHKTGDRHCH
ncbi:YHYH domain-containing protein [Acinetobacter beijerinckii]